MERVTDYDRRLPYRYSTNRSKTLRAINFAKSLRSILLPPHELLKVYNQPFADNILPMRIERKQIMIRKFGTDTALLMIDVQEGVDVLKHWGGTEGRRNNPEAETHIGKLLAAWRAAELPVLYTAHDSREAASPLKLCEPGGAFKSGLEPRAEESVFEKDVNSGFIGTSLEIDLRRRRIDRLVAVGFFTNMCVATTVRMAGNMGFDTYLVTDACACTNRVGPDGTDYDAELVHAMTIANLHGEFCTGITTEEALGLLGADATQMERVQGNE